MQESHRKGIASQPDPRSCGGRREVPTEALTDHIYGKEEHLQVVWRAVWLRDVMHKVRVVVVATTLGEKSFLL